MPGRFMALRSEGSGSDGHLQRGGAVAREAWGLRQGSVTPLLWRPVCHGGDDLRIGIGLTTLVSRLRLACEFRNGLVTLR